MPNIQFSEQAKQDLKEIYQYGYFEYGEIKADNYMNELEECFEFLFKNPLAARERLEFKPPVRIHYHAKHLIVYQKTTAGILIIRLLHQRMEIKNHL